MLSAILGHGERTSLIGTAICGAMPIEALIRASRPSGL
jgi:hypothetical protein